MGIKNGLLQILFPPIHCQICGSRSLRDYPGLCAACYEKLKARRQDFLSVLVALCFIRRISTIAPIVSAGETARLARSPCHLSLQCGGEKVGACFEILSTPGFSAYFCQVDGGRIPPRQHI